KEITIDATHTITGQRRAVLEGESIYFDFKTTESIFLKKEDDMILTTSWPEIVRSQIINTCKVIREIEIDTDIWNYDTIIQAFGDLTELENSSDTNYLINQLNLQS
ncbi:28854_t:CDS:2, partial [Gigaspora margarita]